jgi:hypothetical protein
VASFFLFWLGYILNGATLPPSVTFCMARYVSLTFIIFSANFPPAEVFLHPRLQMVFVTIFILLIASPLQQSQPNSGVKKGAVQENHSQKHSGSDDKHTPKPASDAVLDGCSVQTPTGQNQTQDTYDPRKDTLYRAYLGFTIAGVFLALLGIGFIYKQTRHIGAQTEYLRRQNVISQTTARQWVRFDGWRQHLHDDDRHILEISFNVVNPTPIPLYLDAVVTKADTTTATIAIGTVLIPDHPYPLQILPFLGIEKLAHYQGGKLVPDSRSFRLVSG